ncbi:MAG: hypothetical protein J0L58_08850 [Burkholderiales bacterium]|nr:hypothetical protein [Burkholderiales bacterium]
MKQALALLLLGGVAWASAQPAEEGRRWALVRDHGQVSDMQSFLGQFPDSAHAPEVRARLMAKQLQPLSKLAAGGAACVAVIQERGESLLKGYRTKPAYQGMALNIDAAQIATTGSQEFLPAGQARFADRPEAALALDLVARRHGACVLMQRFSSGSGLPEACRCEPLDAGYRFESALAKAVLSEYSQYRGAQAACSGVAPVPAERSALIEGFLDDWINGYSRWLQAVQARQQRGANLLPSELGQAEDVGYALPQVRERTLLAPEFERAQKAIAERPTEQREAYCAQDLPARVEQARMRILLSTRLSP